MDYQKSQKKITKFYCEICDYSTSHKNDFNKHLLTIKHINAKWITKNPKNSQQDNDNKNYCNNEFFECTCGKKYKYKQGLYKHKKTCILLIDISNSNESNNASISNDIVENKSIISNDMIIKLINENNEIKNTLIQENKELRNQINTLIPKIGTNIKQKFNINVFLNEKCKDALNMNEFVKSIQISLEQLDYTKNNGLESGISNVLIENINKLSIFERPLHCTDAKRETLYIKDNNSWEKDTSKDKIKTIIKNLSTENYKTLNNWIEKNPDYQEDADKQEYFVKTLSMLGKNNSTDDKIIKNLCNEFYIKDIV